MFKIFNKIVKSYKRNHKIIEDHFKSDLSKETASLSLATLRVHYINENGINLKKADSFNGPLNTRTNFIIPSFKGHVICKIVGNPKYFNKNNNDVFIKYQSINGKPVNVFFINLDNYLMVKNYKTIIGKYHTKYRINPPKITGYKLKSHIGELKGQYDNHIKSIVMYYQKSNWLKITRESYYIKSKNNINVFNNTEKNKIIRNIPKNSKIKIFYQVKTENYLWLNIGGNQWIINDSFTPIYHPFGSFLKNTNNWQIISLNKVAYLKSDIYNNKVSIFNYPSGEIIRYGLDNKEVKITLSIIDENNKHWYEINNLFYIKAENIQ
ncbi:MucBP domain-containing protein [Apilactobacillus apisilvae]|uniref:MucBP domain-containing protein n=1 Tax=Apilactobacillus apisilvae TaxID=2923364 RepID=A0ABY4PIT1_9LACO|nr:MucBP domain-containing protein [Apilactobacillus apisilvae]UQS85570.1 MucBP domain-containing protein [Apilactobacillus apisilvae]